MEGREHMVSVEAFWLSACDAAGVPPAADSLGAVVLWRHSMYQSWENIARR
jgi:hypothetical protein